jgi:hypothetical protein
MNTQPQTRGNGSASTALLIIGGTILLIALGGIIALYVWGHTPQEGGEQWGDVIASAYIVCGGFPVFLLGLILLLRGLVLKGKSQSKAEQGDRNA